MEMKHSTAYKSLIERRLQEVNVGSSLIMTRQRCNICSVHGTHFLRFFFSGLFFTAQLIH
jgi:hypothetical protein